MDDWQSYWEQGRSFYNTARGGYRHPEKFNPDALFNLVAMAVEKMSMALLLRKSVMPEGHTFQDLAACLDEVVGLPDDLQARLTRLDDYQAVFCSLSPVFSEPIRREDVPSMLETCDRFEEFALGCIGDYLKAPVPAGTTVAGSSQIG